MPEDSDLIFTERTHDDKESRECNGVGGEVVSSLYINSEIQLLHLTFLAHCDVEETVL